MDNRRAIAPALRAALLFSILSTLWITLSDHVLVLQVGEDPTALVRWSMAKGIAYTLVVALAIYALVRRDFRVIQAGHAKVEAGHAHLRMLLNSMPQAVIVADCQGRIRFVNDGAVSLYGHTEEALLQMDAAQLTTAESPGSLSQCLQAAQRGQPFNARTVDVRKSGDTFDADIHSVPIRWHEEPCILVSITEVSRQRRLERELRESAHQYTQLTQNSRDLIIRCTKDAYVLAANIATLDMLGCSSSAALCRPLSELELDSTSIKQLEAAIQQTFATSLSASCSTTLTSRRGQRQVDWQIVPEFGQQDHVRGVLLVGRDLTEQIAMQAKLGSSEARLNALLDRVHGGMWSYYPAESRLVLDKHLHGVLEWQGKRALTGDTPITPPYHPADVEAVTGALTAVISGESDTLDSIHRLRRERSADWVWVHSWGHCTQRDARGQAIEIIGIAFDITRQRTVEMGNAFIVRLLNRLVEGGNRKALIKDMLSLVKSFTTVDAVAIRVKQDDDYPYYVNDGLSDEMVEKENLLCPQASGGSSVESGGDSPTCLCGRVILGKVNPRLPYYTPGGSFLASIGEGFDPDPAEQPGLVLRGTCMDEGYQTIALVPLRNLNGTIGLLQLLDRRPDAISKATVTLMELASSAIGLAIEASE